MRRLLGFLIVIVVLVAVFRGCDQETGGVEEKEEHMQGLPNPIALGNIAAGGTATGNE